MDKINNLVEILTEILKFTWLWDLIKDAFLWCLEQILGLLLQLLDWAISIMPSMGLAQDAVNMMYKPAQVIGYLNWVVPMDVASFCINLTLANLGVFYLGGWALRWLKIIK